MIIISSHASYVNGKIFEAPVNTLAEILMKKADDFVHIRHSIDGSIRSKVYFYRKGKVAKEKNLLVVQNISIARYLTEIFATFFFLISLRSVSPKVYIGADPLNAISGVWARKVGGIKKSIFYSVDYSKKRFESRLLNNLYQSIDRYCARSSDQVWCVSSRIHALRREQGVKDARNIFIPNSPSSEYKKFLSNKKQKNKLITLGLINDQFDFQNLLEAVAELKKEKKEIYLDIIGDGPKLDYYKSLAAKLGISTHVKFAGYVDHSKALDYISKAGIGLALYNGNWSFNYYGDSMKCREYFCFGLPVISTDTHSTVTEIREGKAGVVVPMDKNEYKKAILKILSNYDEYAVNAKNLSLKYENVHSKMIEGLE